MIRQILDSATAKRLLSSLLRAGALIVVGLMLLSTDAAVAQRLAIPALAPILLSAGWLCVAAAISHVARVILFPRLDLTETGWAAIKAKNTGAGLVFLGMCIVLAALLLSQARAQTLADRAAEHLPTLVAEQRQHWPDAYHPCTLAGQVEAESAWRSTAELKTSREHGAGLAQLTRVVRPDGSVVFDRLADARRLHPSLADWTWDQRFDAARQLRAMVLMMRAEWAAITGAAGPTDRWAFALAAYNGGRAGMQRDRALCAGTRGCDSAMWFEHVERHSWRSKVTTPEYGRSFFDIGRAYVRSIVTERRYRYSWGWA